MSDALPELPSPFDALRDHVLAHSVKHGDFTLKGVTKQISFPFDVSGAIKDNRGNTRLGVAAETKINRRDYGITWGAKMPNGGLNVGDEVVIDLQLEAIKAAAPASQ